MNNAEHYTIRDLADEFSITTRTIRFYEDKGLMQPAREGQRRIYGKGDRARLKLILRGKRLGFTLDEITQLVSLYETPEDTVPQLEQYLDTLRSHRALLEKQRADIERTLTDLTRAEDECRQALSATLAESQH